MDTRVNEDSGISELQKNTVSEVGEGQSPGAIGWCRTQHPTQAGGRIT